MREESEQRDQLGLEQPAHAGFEVSPKDKACWAAWRRESVTTRDSRGSAVSDDLQGKVRLMTISWQYLPKPACTLVQWMHDVASWLGWSTDSQVPFPVGLWLGWATSETFS